MINILVRVIRNVKKMVDFIFLLSKNGFKKVEMHTQFKINYTKKYYFLETKLTKQSFWIYADGRVVNELESGHKIF